ncbi:hypothetical protein [Fluviicola sp.]|uniref:hypothetical protein n=1 Tax=Fluviicola sp. TaxID=1917219 RepID=UPI0031DF7D6B
MAIRNRNTLIEGFSKGQRPTADDFKNLIDSTVNILDDGFSKDAQSGIKLAPISEQEGTVMTFLQNMTDDAGGRWEFDILNNDMKISRVSEKEKNQLILLKQNGEIELGEEGCDIHVKGTLHTEQRSGKNLKQVPANGKWQNLTELLPGIRALEVVCVMGKRHTGKHAVLVAHATHCFGAKPRIKYVRSHFGMFGNKLILRWHKSPKDRACQLQVRTRFKLGDDIYIQSSITSLWDNPLMENL